MISSRCFVWFLGSVGGWVWEGQGDRLEGSAPGSTQEGHQHVTVEESAAGQVLLRSVVLLVSQTDSFVDVPSPLVLVSTVV
jgi:hypothetical protein